MNHVRAKSARLCSEKAFQFTLILYEKHFDVNRHQITYGPIWKAWLRAAPPPKYRDRGQTEGLHTLSECSISNLYGLISKKYIPTTEKELCVTPTNTLRTNHKAVLSTRAALEVMWLKVYSRTKHSPVLHSVLNL